MLLDLVKFDNGFLSLRDVEFEAINVCLILKTGRDEHSNGQSFYRTCLFLLISMDCFQQSESALELL